VQSRSPRSRIVVVAGVVAAAAFASKGAMAADRVAVLRFMGSGGGTTSMQLDAARGATREAVGLVHDVLPSDAELKAAEAAVKDGTPDTSDEYRDAGKVAAAQWTVAGHVDAHGWTYRLEIDACQVATGRVESLAREVDARQAAPQIAEMLALLLRPQGVGDAVPPWDQSPPPVAPKPAPIVPTPLPLPAPMALPAPTPPPVPSPAPEPDAYGVEHPFGLGLGGEVLAAFVRSKEARGSSTAGVFTASAQYAIESVHGLELVGDIGAGSVGPTSFRLDVGARYVLPIVRAAHLYAGPEAALGAFFALGGDKDARFLARGELPVIWAATSSVQIEAYPALAYAAGGTASLGFVGGGARVVIRF
jgi:hypothetical protein